MQNRAALLAPYVLYTPIAHGITGGHVSRQLSVSQLAAHSIALSIVGVLVATAQRRALQGECSPLSRVGAEVPETGGCWRVAASKTRGRGFVLVRWVVLGLAKIV